MLWAVTPCRAAAETGRIAYVLPLIPPGSIAAPMTSKLTRKILAIAVLTGVLLGPSSGGWAATVAGLEAQLLGAPDAAQLAPIMAAAGEEGLTEWQIAHALGRAAYLDQGRAADYRAGLHRLEDAPRVTAERLNNEFEAGWRSEVLLRDQRALTYPPLGGIGGSEGGRNE